MDGAHLDMDIWISQDQLPINLCIGMQLDSNLIPPIVKVPRDDEMNGILEFCLEFVELPGTSWTS